MEFHHIPILLPECLTALEPERGGVFVDCTAGGGGHSFGIASRLPEDGHSRLICLDRDDEAIAACRARLSPLGDRFTIVKSNFRDLDAALRSVGVDHIDGVLWDLGVSSHQLDDAERGFSYTADAPLDMRMDQSAGLSASDVVNTYPEEELKRILWIYGEEKFSGRVARAIVQRREKSPIRTTLELAETVAGAIPTRQKESQHPARRAFQAIRIEVNGELDAIEPSIRAAVEHMRPGGRLAVITFHSLEDRIVKETFRALATGCTCPPNFPVCVCGGKPKITLLSKKPIAPSEKELSENPRSHSAKLRVAERTEF